MGIPKAKYDLGFTHIVQAKNGTMKRIIACSPNEIKDVIEVKNKRDVFYTPNTFNSPIKRERHNLWQLHSFYIDIDHKEGTGPIDQYEVAIAIQELVNKNIIPEPSEYISSGRGIHVYWYINDCHVMLLDLWEKLEEYIYNSIKVIEKKINNIKVDKLATDPTRLLRLVGTINSRSNEECYSMLKNENIYNIFDLKKQYLKPIAKKKKSSSKISFLPTKNLYTLNMSRIEDFKTILELRKGQVKGYRNALIMLYSYHYRLANEVTVEELIKNTKAFNKGIKEPYPVKELTSVCRSVNRTVKYFREDNSKGYKFTNKYIIDMLELTLEEQQQLKTIISTDEKYRRKNKKRNEARRNEEGLTPKQQEMKELNSKVVELKEQGLSLRKIAAELNITLGKVQRVLKK